MTFSEYIKGLKRAVDSFEAAQLNEGIDPEEELDNDQVEVLNSEYIDHVGGELEKIHSGDPELNFDDN